jgi:uncharacterized membrane protein
MRMMLLIHVLCGGLGLISGYVALAVTKGATVHRRVGMLFVCVMVTLSVTGMLISAVEGIAPAINIPTALLTFYFVLTSLSTVRPPAARFGWLDTAAMVMALATGLGCFALGFRAIGLGGREAGMAYPLFMFGLVALIASAGDRRMIRTGALRGVPRLARHLWRMCFALFIASIAFYLGPDRIPAAIRTPALIAGGVLVPIVAMSYWLWRLRRRPTVRGVVRVAVHEAI